MSSWLKSLLTITVHSFLECLKFPVSVLWRESLHNCFSRASSCILLSTPSIYPTIVLGIDHMLKSCDISLSSLESPSSFTSLVFEKGKKLSRQCLLCASDLSILDHCQYSQSDFYLNVMNLTFLFLQWSLVSKIIMA